MNWVSLLKKLQQKLRYQRILKSFAKLIEAANEYHYSLASKLSISGLRQDIQLSDRIYPKLDEEVIQALIQAIQKRIQADRADSQPTTTTPENFAYKIFLVRSASVTHLRINASKSSWR